MEFMQSNRIDSGQNGTVIGGDGTADAALNTEGSSEGDSEDEWYRQMEASAQGDDKEESFGSNDDQHLHQKKREFKSDVEYFDEMQKVVESGAESSVVRPEDDPIWQTILRDMVRLGGNTDTGTAITNAGIKKSAQSLIKVEHDSKADLMLLEQFLFSHLPFSSKTYFLVHAQLRSEETSDKRFETWADDIMHPSIVILIDCLGVQDVCVFSSILPPTAQVLEAVHSLLEGKVAAWKSLQSSTAAVDDTCSTASTSTGSHSESINEAVLKFAAIDARLMETISTTLCAASYSVAYDIAMDMYTLEDGVSMITTGASRILPGGFILVDLGLEDCTCINDRWEYRSDTSLSMIERCVKGFPGMGIRDTSTGLLVSWCITYEYGALGMTYTESEFRGRGFARSVVAAILRRWLKQGYGCAPFVYIHDTNEPSKAVFTSLGFRKFSYSTWSGFK